MDFGSRATAITDYDFRNLFFSLSRPPRRAEYPFLPNPNRIVKGDVDVPKEKLGRLRQEVDRLNAEILDRIQQRAELVLEIAQLKKSQGMGDRDRLREQVMLSDLLRSRSGPFNEAEIRTIFQAIFDASLALMVRTEQNPSSHKSDGVS